MNTKKPLIALAVLLAVTFLPSCLAQFSVGPGWNLSGNVTPSPTPSTFTTPTPTPFDSTNPTSDVTANPTSTTEITQPTTNPTEQPTPTAPELSIFALIGVMSLLACGVLVAKTRRHKLES